MEGPARPIWFAGDLGDPWVVAIADALPRDARRLDCPAELPDPWPADGPDPGVVVLHRPNLTSVDAVRLARLRSRPGPTARVILCFGPNARHDDLVRWSRLVDVAIPEATAGETLARHVLGLDRPTPHRAAPRRVAVVSASHELRSTLADAFRAGGYAPEVARDWPDAAPAIAAVWDVPVLEPDWPDRIARRSGTSPVVALIGFADRATVRLARENGASACLELPCEVEDLLIALDRVSSGPIGEPAHEVPPPPMLAKNPGGRSPKARGSL